IIMARRPLATRTRRRNMTLRNILTSVLLMYYYVWLLMALAYRRKCLKIERRLRIKERRAENLNDLIGSDTKCISELRMDRRTFYILCEMVRDVGGLKATRNMTLEEIKSILTPDQEAPPFVDWWLRSRKLVIKDKHPGFDTLVILVAWRLWKERNKRVFDFQALQPVALAQEIIDEASLWSLARFTKLRWLLESTGTWDKAGNIADNNGLPSFRLRVTDRHTRESEHAKTMYCKARTD
ncbi:hypothetical protein EJB05_38210, partial [Eragrostis curvula]